MNSMNSLNLDGFKFFETTHLDSSEFLESIDPINPIVEKYREKAQAINKAYHEGMEKFDIEIINAKAAVELAVVRKELQSYKEVDDSSLEGTIIVPSKIDRNNAMQKKFALRQYEGFLSYILTDINSTDETVRNTAVNIFKHYHANPHYIKSYAALFPKDKQDKIFEADKLIQKQMTLRESMLKKEMDQLKQDLRYDLNKLVDEDRSLLQKTIVIISDIDKALNINQPIVINQI